MVYWVKYRMRSKTLKRVYATEKERDLYKQFLERHGYKVESGEQ